MTKLIKILALFKKDIISFVTVRVLSTLVRILFHSRSKHIDIRYYQIRDALNFKLLELKNIHTDEIDSDMLTKVLPKKKVEGCCSMVRMMVPNK